MAVYEGEFLATIEGGVVREFFPPESPLYETQFDRAPGSVIETEDPSVTVVVPDDTDPEDVELPGDTEPEKKDKKDKRRKKFKDKVDKEKDK